MSININDSSDAEPVLYVSVHVPYSFCYRSHLLIRHVEVTQAQKNLNFDIPVETNDIPSIQEE
jgi:hypothetical protein